MTYLITRATGDVGSRVVRQLIELDIHPRILIRNEEKARALLGQAVDTRVSDLADPESARWTPQ